MAQVQDIKAFFESNTRAENDATNKIRETVMKVIDNPPQEYLNHEVHGEGWRTLHREWKNVVKQIAKYTGIRVYTHTNLKVKAGRKHNYDLLISYYDEYKVVAVRQTELKKGGSKIDDQPQFLSLQAKFGLFSVTYDVFFYKNYLTKYLACDTGITQPIPSHEEYVKCVTSVNYSITPFFAQMKERELFFQEEKKKVVNDSITDYVTRYGSTIDIATFCEKLKATQTDKIYVLWSHGKFSIDKITNEEMTGMTFDSIKNGNVLQLKSGNTIFGLLLRWRNHKGILNPAWQISLKRTSPE
jgi:hypothetical protein